MNLRMETEQCQLLGGLFSTLVQATLGFLCVSALVIKRHNEFPQRDWYVWFLDVMKQAIGSSFGHFSNIFLSVFIAGNIENADECQWYCMTYIADCTIGTFFNILFLKLFESCMLKLFGPECSVMNFGEYGTPPQLCIWFPQLIVWMTIVTIAKICTLYIVYQFLAPLNDVLSYVFDVFNGQPELELVVVMIFIPTILNTLVFWVTDTFLMKDKGEEERASDSELDEELIAQTSSRHGDDDNPFTHSTLHINTTNITNTNTTSNSTSISTTKKHRGVYSSVSTTSSTDLNGIELSDGSSSPNAYERKYNTANSNSIWSYIPTLWGNTSKTSKSGKITRNGSDERLHTTTSLPIHTTHTTHSSTSAPKSGTTYHSVSSKNNSVYTGTGYNSDNNTKSYIGTVQNITKRGSSGNGGNSVHNVSSSSIDVDDMYL